MKISTATTFITMIATASAFAPNQQKSTTSTTSLSEKSKALPWLEKPSWLDGTYPGDAGFDPLGFAKTDEAMVNQRMAEIKHARLAMLAAAGWPLSELFDRKIAEYFNLEPAVDAADRAPSLLNGGLLDRVPPAYWAAVIVGASYIEYIDLQKNEQASFPGDFGWDPLGLYPADEEGQRRMQLAEIKNGRTAMVAITAFAFQEYAQKFGVVDATPMFFKPANELAAEYGSDLGAEIVSQNVNNL